jgi:hypothetical protein
MSQDIVTGSPSTISLDPCDTWTVNTDYTFIPGDCLSVPDV